MMIFYALEMPCAYVVLPGKLQILVNGVSSHAGGLAVSVIHCKDLETRFERGISHETVKEWGI